VRGVGVWGVVFLEGVWLYLMEGVFFGEDWFGGWEVRGKGYGE
jgi:hypothetical protein